MFLDSATRAMGMTTAKWMQLPVHELAVSSLTPTQSIVGLLPVHEPNATTCADPYIHVLRLGGALYVQDGHHRLARAQRAHQWTIQGRVLDLTVGLTIVATRGERTIRWKCVDIRELRERSEIFLSQGYTLSVDLVM